MGYWKFNNALLKDKGSKGRKSIGQRHQRLENEIHVCLNGKNVNNQTAFNLVQKQNESVNLRNET